MLPQHTLNSPEGALTLWVLPIVDLAPAQRLDQHRKSNPFSDRYVFLTDREAVQDTHAAAFALFFERYWHPVLMAKWVMGDAFMGLWSERPGAIAMANHFEMPRDTWMSMGVTWNHDAGRYRVYANGILIAAENTFPHAPSVHEPCGPELYGGTPSVAFGACGFYNTELDPSAVQRIFEATAPEESRSSLLRLKRVYEGSELAAADWSAEEGFEDALNLSLKDPADYGHFFNQGCATAVDFQAEGLRIHTPGLERFFKTRTDAEGETDMARMYLWTRRVFEGDLHVSVEFQLLNHGGLALLMVQAAGMNGEDFLADYPLRTNGAMRCVCWEDICNYHWEFYREMLDTRNDLVSHAMLKNPWYKPMTFQMEPRRWELNRWYRLEFLQTGNRLRGSIDGIQVIDVTDSSFENNGPVFRHGHIALRCMMRTDLMFRNLHIRTRKPYASTEISCEGLI